MSTAPSFALASSFDDLVIRRREADSWHYGQMRRVRRCSSSLLAIAFFVAACGDDSGQALPSVPRSAVPAAAPTVGEEKPITLAGDNCIRAGDLTLVFVEGQAELTEVGPELRLEVRSVAEDGTGSVASVPIGEEAATPVGYPLDRPTEWAAAPSEGCGGPYFLVTGLDDPMD